MWFHTLPMWLAVCVNCLPCSTFDASLLQLYTSLETGVERSDLWRYTVMCRHGGVYADVDTLCVKPVQVGRD